MKKSGLAVILAVGLLVGFAFSNIIFPNPAYGSTNFNGIISSNTTWTKANSPYSLTGPVAINIGATLTIEAGVTVQLNGYYIQVNGTLVARGTTSEKIFINAGNPISSYDSITFTSLSNRWNETTGNGCILENALLNGTSIIAGGAKISSSYIVGPEIEADSSIISNNTILQSENFGPLIYVYGASPTISNNTIRGYVDILVTGANASPAISNNVLTGDSDSPFGIEVIASSGNITISGNVVSGYTDPYLSFSGIYLPKENSANVTLEKNLIFNNGKGIDVRSSAQVLNNTITRNAIGITGNLSSSISYNNIYNNSQFNAKLESYGNVNLPNNWWGTTDAQAIGQTIRDFKFDFNVGNVTFAPFLISLNPFAPSDQYAPPNPTPSPSPTPTPSPSYTITMTHVGQGVMSPADGQYTYPLSTITLTATPAANYSFMCWLENGILLSESNPYNYSVTKDCVLTGVFYDPVAKTTPSPEPTPTPSTAPSPTPTDSLAPTSTPTQTQAPTQTTPPPSTNNPTATLDPTTSPQPTSSPAIPELPTWTAIATVIALTLSTAVYFRRKKKQP
jgi:parallel beta-helix repeat protein